TPHWIRTPLQPPCACYEDIAENAIADWLAECVQSRANVLRTSQTLHSQFPAKRVQSQPLSQLCFLRRPLGLTRVPALYVAALFARRRSFRRILEPRSLRWSASRRLPKSFRPHHPPHDHAENVVWLCLVDWNPANTEVAGFRRTHTEHHSWIEGRRETAAEPNLASNATHRRQAVHDLDCPYPALRLCPRGAVRSRE